jgi:hypothetical protein
MTVSYLHAVVKVYLVTGRRPHPRYSNWVTPINQRSLYQLVVKKVLVRYKVGRRSIHVATGATNRFGLLARLVAYVRVDRNIVGPLQRHRAWDSVVVDLHETELVDRVRADRKLCFLLTDNFSIEVVAAHGLEVLFCGAHPHLSFLLDLGADAFLDEGKDRVVEAEAVG